MVLLLESGFPQSVEAGQQSEANRQLISLDSSDRQTVWTLSYRHGMSLPYHANFIF
jgi:hypothetical protein